VTGAAVKAGSPGTPRELGYHGANQAETFPLLDYSLC